MIQHRVSLILDDQLFLSDDNDWDFGPDGLSFSVPSPVPRQDRFSLDPQHVHFWSPHNFRLAWASPYGYPRTVPFTAVIKPGLLLDINSDHLDPEWLASLNSLLGLDVPQDAFISTPTGLSYYSQVKPNISSITSSILDTDQFSHCDSFEVIYSNHKLTLQFYTSSFKSVPQTTIHQSSRTELEVGILHIQHAASTEDDISLAGIIFKPSAHNSLPTKTLIHITPRHRSISSSYKSYFELPTGLHPKNIIDLQDLKSPLEPSCKLFAHYTVPNALFFDKYQLETKKDLNLIGLWGATDLEDPSWLTDQFGSQALFELNSSSSTFEVPLHSRYQLPSSSSSSSSYMSLHKIPYPTVFWACDSDNNYIDQLLSNPFDPINLEIGDYQSLFTPNTVFYHINENDKNLEINYTIPTIPKNVYSIVNLFTLFILIVGFIWFIFKFLTIKAKRNLKND